MNKVVIIPKKDEENLYHILPLIKGLEIYFEGMDEAFQIHVLHSKDLRSQSALLKNKCYFHDFDEKELGPLASLKLVEKLKDLFNLSHSFCFRDDLGALTLQKFLKAKKRYGFSSLQAKVANNNFFSGYEELEGKDLYAKALSDFFKVHKDQVMDHLKEEFRSHEPNVENFFKAREVEPFVLKIFDELSEESEKLLLIKTLVKDLEKKTYLWLEKENEISRDTFHQMKGLLNISEAHPLDFDAYLEKCIGVITTKAWVAEMAAFFGVDVIFFDVGEYRLESFINDRIVLVKTLGPGFYQLSYRDEEKEVKEVEASIDSLNDFIFERFNL